MTLAHRTQRGEPDKISPFIVEQPTFQIQSDIQFHEYPISTFMKSHQLVFAYFEEDNSLYLEPEREIKKLETIYTFIKPKEVKKFLRWHEPLISTLFEAEQHIKQIFDGYIIELCLEFNSDPEENFKCLSVVIKTNLNPELALKLLDDLDENWWLDVDDNVRSILIIMVRTV